MTVTRSPNDGEIPFVDGHNDTLLRIYSNDRPGGDFLDGETGDAAAESHLDLPRAREAGMAAGLFAAFVLNSEDPDSESVDLHAGEYPPAVDPTVSRRVVFDQFARLHRWAAESESFRIISDADDLEACLEGDTSATSASVSGGTLTASASVSGGALGAIPHIEGAAAVEPDLSNLDLLYAAGLRSIGIVWSRPNQFADGVPFVHDASPDTGPGLTEAGRRLVRGCNERGILVDCAHLNEAGFWDVIEETAAPPVVSHAGAHAVCPATRNLTDEMLRAVGTRDGLVGLSFGVSFLRPDGADDPDTELSVLADHLDHIIDVAGIDSVALGSDFDGATIPDAIGDVGGVRDLFEVLHERGYTKSEIEKIAHENWLRVLRDTWE